MNENSIDNQMNIEQRERDLYWMNQAIELSKKCPPAETFNVGCIILDKDGKLVASGYSREREGGVHAEEIAFAKLDEGGIVADGGVLYSTVEPCHPRKSGKTSCTEHTLRHHIAKVVYVLEEPVFFVDCKGAETLRENGMNVVRLEELNETVKSINSHIFSQLN